MADESDDAAALAWLSEAERALPEGADRGAPFAHGLWPLVESAWAGLARPGSPAAELGAIAGEQVRTGLLRRLVEVAAPALAMEMDRNLPFGQRFIMRIGPDPEDPPRIRYASFCRRLAEDGVALTGARYPLLAALVDTAIRQWAESTGELLDRVDADRDALERVLGVPRDAVLTAVLDSAGDRHNDGRSVCVLAFGSTRVVYKPRDVRLEELYSAVVNVVPGALPGSPLVAPAVLARVDADGAHYGYVEFVEGDANPGDADRADFYRNAGQALALLYALAATDAHTENLIVHGNRPVLIDAETLFTPASTPGSVLDVGMLPGWLWLDGHRLAIDVSALGAAGPEARRRVGTAWRSINTDAMNRGRAGTDPPDAIDGVTADVAAATLAEHVDDLVDGFAEAYRVLTGLRRELLDVLERARGLAHRVVHRPTYVYASLLRQSLQPDALSSVEARAAVIDGLERAYRAPATAAMRPLLAAETEAITRLDVPYFTAPVEGGRTRWHPAGELPGWPEGDGLEHAMARIRDLDEADLSRQVALIRGSVSARGFRMGRDQPAPAAGPTAHRAVPRNAADACVAAVVSSAIGACDSATWMGLSLLPDGIRANLQPMGTGLYDGRLGLAVGLHAWADATGATDDGASVRAWADAAMAPVLDLLTSVDASARGQVITAMGLGMSGAGGYLRGIDVLARAGHVSAAQRHRVIDRILGLVTAEVVAQDRGVDQMAGATGLVAPLCRILAETRDARAAILLRAAADAIVDRQDPVTGGWVNAFSAIPLTGLAHGASGMALALAEAAVALDAPSYLTAMRRGLDYESGLLDPTEGNWLDLRPDVRTTGTGFMKGWCAGAPGIGLARLRLLELLPGDPDAARWRAESEVAMRTTATGALLMGDHVCCGNLGRVIVLRCATAVTGDPQWSHAADAIVDAVLDRAGDGMPRSALGATAEELAMPGLMMGLTGIALALLGEQQTDWAPLVLL
jgi:type 2 lantibiotic biosynthesis protein LanM